MRVKERELHRISCTAIIYRGRKFLLVRRSLKKKAFPGKWTVPGGGLEVDDYLKTAKTTRDHWYFAIENSLRREIREETNLAVGKIRYLLDIAFIRPDGIAVVILSFYCPYKSGRVKLDEDNIDYVWLSFNQAKKYDLVEGLLGELEMIDKIIKGKNPDRLKYQWLG